MPPKSVRGPISLQSRDVQLLRGLFDSRLMTLAHATALYFGGRSEAAKKRVQKLKAVGLIGERPRRVYDPSIIYLTRVGFTHLENLGEFQNLPRVTWAKMERRLQVSELTLRHELGVLDVKAPLWAAIGSRARFRVEEFTTWPALIEFTASPTGGAELLMKPDGFLRIQETDTDGVFEHAFFLELDRSTETLDILSRKALCYLNYYQSGGFALRFGHLRSEYKDFPFRVLMVFKTAERRNNIAERLLTGRTPILTQVCLSTIKEVQEDPLGPIWVRPRDYRDALAGTTYAIGTSNSSLVYRRQTERDAFIESTVIKQRLLTPEIPTSLDDKK